MDVKPVVAKIETNMWQSTGITTLNKITTTLVKNGRNIDIMDYQNLSWEEKVSLVLLWWKFAATKQWDKTDVDKEKIRQDLNKVAELKEGDEGYIVTIDDPRVLIVCESYNAYEKLGVAEDLVRYITEGQLVDDLGFEGIKGEPVAQVIQNLINEANEWATYNVVKFLNLFISRKTTETYAIFNDENERIAGEVQSLKEEGIRVRSIIFDSSFGESVYETGKVIDVTDRTVELTDKKDNIKYDSLDGKSVIGREKIEKILNDIANRKKAEDTVVVYVESTILSGNEDLIDTYAEKGIFISTNSIKAAYIKALIAYKNKKSEALESITLATSIYGTYKAGEVTEAVLRELINKGIGNILIDVTGADQKSIENAVKISEERNMNVAVFGDGAEKVKLDEQKKVINYNKDFKITDITDPQNTIVNISRTERENLVITPQNIQMLISMGVAIAFDGTVLREISKENTAEEGMTLLDIVKAMFEDTPEEKAKKDEARGIREGRALDLNLSFERGDLLTDNVLLSIINKLSNEDTSIYATNPNPSIKELLNTLVYLMDPVKDKAIIEKIQQGKISIAETIGLLDGILQRVELGKLLTKLQKSDKKESLSELMERYDNLDDIMKYLVEYVLATYKSQNRSSYDSYNPEIESETLKGLSGNSNEVFRDLTNLLEASSLTPEERADAIAGILEILLLGFNRLEAQTEVFGGMETNKLHALLSAA